jgi:hypothetical protein
VFSALAVALSIVTVSVDAQSKALFSYHSNAWVNLHHFIRAVARGVPARAELSEQERAVWTAGVELYKPYAARDLTFDQGLIDIKYALHLAEGKASLEGVKIDPAVRGTLERVMPIYQKHWWPAHGDRVSTGRARSQRCSPSSRRSSRAQPQLHKVNSGSVIFD